MGQNAGGLPGGRLQAPEDRIDLGKVARHRSCPVCISGLGVDVLRTLGKNSHLMRNEYFDFTVIDLTALPVL